MDRVLLGGHAVSESEAIVHLIAAQVVAAVIIFIVGLLLVISDRRHREANEAQPEAEGCGEKGEKDDASHPIFAGEVPGTQQRASGREVDGVQEKAVGSYRRGIAMSAQKDTESKEVTPLTPGELMKLVLPMSESMYLTVKLLVKERDDWQAFADSKAQELEDVCRERDEWKAAAQASYGHDLEKAIRERDIALAHIASLHTAWEDWKVFHSTSRLEAEHAAERYKLRQEVEHERFLREQAEAMCAQVQDQREGLRQERDAALLDANVLRDINVALERESNPLADQRDAFAADSATLNDLLLSALNLFDPYGDGRLIATQSECADVYKRIANHVLPRGNE